MPAANKSQDSTQQVARLGLTLILSRLMASELPFAGELHVRGFEAQPYTIRLAFDRAIWIADGDILDRLRVLSQQPVAEAKLLHQRHLLLHVRRRREL